jgi:hypothetical protein
VIASRRKTESSSRAQISRVICVWFCRTKDGKKSLVFNTEGKYTIVKCSIKNLGHIRGSNSRKNNSVSLRYSRMASKCKSPSTHWDILRISTAIFPELQPAERLWMLVDAPLVNQHFESIDQLEEVVAKRCCVLQEIEKRLKN